MTISKRNPLPVNYTYDREAHPNDVFKCDLRNKTDVTNYFNNTFGAGTVTFVGTEGVDYEFDATNGFRTKTNNGGMKLLVNNLLSGDALTYWMLGGLTLDFQVLTSQWIEPAPTPTVAYLNPVTDMNGTACDVSNTYLINFGNNNALGSACVMAWDDIVTRKTKGHNKLHFGFSPNAANPNVASRPCSLLNKGQFLSCRMTLLAGGGAAWIDQMPAVPAHGGSDPVYTGEHFGFPNTAAMYLAPQTVGNAVIWIGQFGTNAAACTRWIRNLRLYNTVTDSSYHPMLARVISFGDSYSATTLGPSAVGSANQKLGMGGDDGENTTAAADNFDFTDIVGSLRFHQLMLQAGYNVGGVYGAGQGGHYFTNDGAANSLMFASDNYLSRLLNNFYPTLCFTFGLYNDVTQVALGATTTATLQALLLASYLKPAMDGGCKGWGFVIPSYSFALNASGATYIQAFNDVATMLLGLPAAFNAAYPQYAGRVKVYDMRTEMGLNWANNPNWQYYYNNAQTVHPTCYAKRLFAEKCAQMTLQWLRGA